MADPYKSNITTLAKRLKPFFMKWMQTFNETHGGLLENKVYLFERGLTPVTAYDGDDTGLGEAIAAAASGDVIKCHAHTFTSAHTIPAGVGVVGMGEGQTIFTGALTLGDESILHNLDVLVNEVDSPDMVYAVLGPGSGTAYIHECHIGGWNTGGTAGAAYGIAKQAGQVYMEGGWLEGGTGPDVTIVEGLGDWRDDFGWEVISGVAIAQNNYSITTVGSTDIALGVATGVKLVYLPNPGGNWSVNPVTVYVTGLMSAIATDVAIPAGRYQETSITPYGGTAIVSQVNWDTVEAYGDTSVYDDMIGTVILAQSPTPTVIAETSKEGGAISLGGSATLSCILTASFSLYSPEEIAQLDELAAVSILVYGVRMDPVEGQPVYGDRSAWDVDNYGSVHASDIYSGSALYHLPTAGTVGHVPIWGGTVWAAGAVEGGTAEAGTVIWYDEGVIAGTASIVNITGSGGTVSVSGGTATIDISAGGSGGSVTIYDEGVIAGTVSILNVTGDGGTISVDGGTAILNITGGGSGGGSVTFYDEGVLAGTVSIMNFTGDGVSATYSGGTAVVDIAAGGGGGGSVTVYDEGVAAGTANIFNFTGSGVTATYSGGTVTISVIAAFLVASLLPGGFASLVITLTESAISAA